MRQVKKKIVLIISKAISRNEDRMLEEDNEEEVMGPLNISFVTKKDIWPTSSNRR